MKKIGLLICFIAFYSGALIAQSSTNETDDTVDTAYIPVEGHSKTGLPKELQGSWILISGIKKSVPAVDLTNKKLIPGTETRRDSATTTTTINGVTHTTTEVEIQRIATTEKQITPLQKSKMHQAEKPGISFYGLNETFSGFTGCNKYSGRYSIHGNRITLRGASASTKMVCLGEYDEKDFLSTLKSVNAYRSNNGKLELLNGSQVLLVFARK